MDKASRVLGTEPLASYAAGFATELAAQGYRPRTIEDHVRLLCQLSRWLAANRLGEFALTPDVTEKFLHIRRTDGRSHLFSSRAVAPLLSFLRRIGVLAEPVEVVARTPAEALLEEFRDYLVRERGLVEGSVRLYANVGRLFLVERLEPTRRDVEHLTAGDVKQFVLREARVRSVASAKTLVTGLRSLLRFLYLDGRIPMPLAEAVPTVAGWRLSSLPRALDAAQVKRLLESCDRHTATGTRDFAILTLLVRLGLRSHEVASLELGDVHWRVGEIVILGKGGRRERLPLPHDVGEALACYVSRFRPRCSSRKLFVAVRAPSAGISAAGVRSVVHHACDRARLPRVGAHRLRHGVATELLRAGAPLSEVGQVLRHRSLGTTAIYAKVDRSALATLALPWPGGEP
jgi:integrase/recombinase XerD